MSRYVNGWIVEGKYTTGRGSEWEELTEVAPTDTGGPGDTLTGREYAYWLGREHQTAAPDGQHRVRPKRLKR